MKNNILNAIAITAIGGLIFKVVMEVRNTKLQNEMYGEVEDENANKE